MNIFVMKNYDKVINDILNINNIPSSVYCKTFIIQKLKYLGEKEGYIINDQFNNWLKIEYSHGMLIVTFFYLNLCVIKDISENIYLKNCIV